MLTSPSSLAITLRELSPEEIPRIYPLIAAHNHCMDEATFRARLSAMQPLGYRVLAAFADEEIIGISGFWVGVRFWCGHHLDLDNFIVLESYRAQGVGARMMAWFEALAQREGIELLGLDVYTNSFLAHRFYHRHGFVQTGYHMTKIPGTTTPFVPPSTRGN